MPPERDAASRLTYDSKLRHAHTVALPYQVYVYDNAFRVLDMLDVPPARRFGGARAAGRRQHGLPAQADRPDRKPHSAYPRLTSCRG